MLLGLLLFTCRWVTVVSQLSKCLKFMAFRGVILYGIQSFLSPRIYLNFRHLFSCDTIALNYRRGGGGGGGGGRMKRRV